MVFSLLLFLLQSVLGDHSDSNVLAINGIIFPVSLEAFPLVNGLIYGTSVLCEPSLYRHAEMLEEEK